jgi:hypothetical protein
MAGLHPCDGHIAINCGALTPGGVRVRKELYCLSRPCLPVFVCDGKRCAPSHNSHLGETLWSTTTAVRLSLKQTCTSSKYVRLT